ncbi:MAG: GntR family transcriptional regulator [Proteobacteria bacterium]|nr:GntR family transcriptional regulator [Pseudomonadota bacterium]MBU4470193.1 GntR family transcriptional regulator [Pseudomonadota bacterium]MCG2752609.1 GntR family transcriptional regulator [Desulfobacteraceae bacterium]
MGLKKICKDNLTNKVYQQIKEAIMSGRFQPGERVPIRQLAEKMGTSTTPVREALLKLVSYGALEMKPAHPIVIPVLDKKGYLENRAIRVVNEGLAAAEAARRITKRQLSKLIKLNEEMINAAKENRFNDSIAHNYAFHIEVCRAADMPALLEFVEILWLKIGPSLNFLKSRAFNTRPKGSSNYHQDILQALENKDPNAARIAMEKDLIEGGETLLDYFEAQSEQSDPLKKQVA